MHLKNFTLIHRKNKIELSPAYDLLNTTILMIENELLRFKTSLNHWEELITNSFLSEKMQKKYIKLIQDRWERLNH